MRHKKTLLLFILGIVLAGVIIAYYPITVKYTNVITAEDSNAYGESILANVNTTLSYVIPFYAKWTYGGSDANYINYNIQFSISANLVEDSFNVEVYLKAVRNDNGNHKVIFSKTETRTGLSDGSETFTYSGSYSVATLLENDLSCSQSGSYQIDFYIKFKVIATGSKSGQTLIAQKDYTLFQSLTFDWTSDTQLYNDFQPSSLANWEYWGGDDPSTAPDKISNEDGSVYHISSTPDDTIICYFNTFIPEGDWDGTLIVNFKITGDVDLNIDPNLPGLVYYDWQASKYEQVDAVAPSDYTHYEFSLTSITLNWYNYNTGEVRVGFKYYAHGGDLYIDYLALQITPYGASWITYFTDYGLIGVLVGVVITLWLLRKEKRR